MTGTLVILHHLLVHPYPSATTVTDPSVQRCHVAGKVGPGLGHFPLEASLRRGALKRGDGRPRGGGARGRSQGIVVLVIEIVIVKIDGAGGSGWVSRREGGERGRRRRLRTE